MNATTIHGDFKRLDEVESKTAFHVCQLNVEREVARTYFGTAPQTVFVDGLGEADHWAVELKCGLVIAFQFVHQLEVGSVFADVPCVQHVRRHLKHWDDELVEVAGEQSSREHQVWIERLSPSNPMLLELTSHQVWRQGDDGNQVKIGSPTTLRDAECWVAEFESHHHKQIYWVSRCKG